MHRFLILGFAALFTLACQEPPTDNIRAIADDYLAGWTNFYPSQALTAGKTDAAPRLEDFSQPTVDAWLGVNRRTLARIDSLPEESASTDESIDRQLLEGQIQRELFRWDEAQIHRTDPQTYSNLINHALTAVLVRGNLTAEAKIRAVMSRLQRLQRLCLTAKQNLADGRPSATEASIHDIRSTASFIEGGLLAALEVPDDSPHRESLAASAAQTAAILIAVADWLESDLSLSLADGYGEDLFARKLALAYGAHMTPEVLERIAMEEIETVRGLMDDLARRSWDDGATDFNDRIRPILAEMEGHRAANQQEFLQEFLDLIDRSRVFLQEEDLIDLPEHETLFTALSPSHFAGAAVGGVYSAGPFDPEAETLFYLPSVPDSAPEEARDGFYRSFNTHFNTMIITHEIYPGHYLQLKAAAHHPSRIRALFTGDDFTEGWASFVEQMTLDAGFDDDQPLTRMAHLRKRLENAVRAYVSVQVHCRGWSADQLGSFAVETGLLPPQFAENLWHRALLTPIQLPSYFIGFRVFDDAYRSEFERLGEAFSAKAFNNAVVNSGGMPMAMVEGYLAVALGGG